MHPKYHVENACTTIESEISGKKCVAVEAGLAPHKNVLKTLRPLANKYTTFIVIWTTQKYKRDQNFISQNNTNHIEDRVYQPIEFKKQSFSRPRLLCVLWLVNKAISSRND